MDERTRRRALARGARTRASSKSETAADGRGAACARAIRQFRSGFRVHDGRTRWTSVDARRRQRRRELAGGARPARAPSPSPPSPPVRVQRETTANDRGGKRAIVFRPSPDVTSRSRSRSRAVRVARVPRRHRSVETSRPFARARRTSSFTGADMSSVADSRTFSRAGSRAPIARGDVVVDDVESANECARA